MNEDIPMYLTFVSMYIFQSFISYPSVQGLFATHHFHRYFPRPTAFQWSTCACLNIQLISPFNYSASGSDQRSHAGLQSRSSNTTFSIPAMIAFLSGTRPLCIHRWTKPRRALFYLTDYAASLAHGDKQAHIARTIGAVETEHESEAFGSSWIGKDYIAQ